MPKTESKESTQKKETAEVKTSKKVTAGAVKKGVAKRTQDRKTSAMRTIRGKERAARARKRDKRGRRDEREFDTRIVSIRRVAKTRAGGRRLRLSVMVVIGDKKGKIGVGIAKGLDVRSAEAKAVNKAKKHMVKIELNGQTIPHEVTYKKGAAKVFLKPAAPGTGVIAGGAVRAVVETAGIKDVLSKVLGTKNIINNVYATFEALKKLRSERV